MVRSCRFSKRCLYYLLSARPGLRLIAHLSSRCLSASLRHDGSRIFFVGLNPQAMKQSRVFLHGLSAFSYCLLGPYSDGRIIFHFIKKSILLCKLFYLAVEYESTHSFYNNVMQCNHRKNNAKYISAEEINNKIKHLSG
ncbi:30S ribosomal S2, chloroplastic [Gossypium arboreum]|uniref:30S ribosomal S2, chloroplastic n=1 Tax=Gossypium arboreum TaxID=29729 RepID=A0A0B0PSA0_GOSAR|nr:30S ribosomal S2, chloroplastic [Gossypium arboreum]